MKIPEVTYIVPIISDIYISRLLYTLWKYSEPDSFRFILIDQCQNRVRPEVWDYIKDKVHLYIHPYKNLGYAKAQNEGIIHALHWKTPYVCCMNDDIEIIDKRWMQGIKDTFAMHKEIVAVVPMTPRVAGWGYGLNYNPEVLPYKEEYSEADYNYLLEGDFSNIENLPKAMPTNVKGSVVDAAAFIMVYFKRETLWNIGLFDERFFPGSGEDYDYNARVYSQDLRIVSTSLSWVWHHWTKSKDLFASGQLENKYYKPRSYWNEMGDIWRPQDNEGHEFDVWAVYTTQTGIKRKLKRVPEIYSECI